MAFSQPCRPRRGVYPRGVTSTSRARNRTAISPSSHLISHRVIRMSMRDGLMPIGSTCVESIVRVDAWTRFGSVRAARRVVMGRQSVQTLLHGPARRAPDLHVARKALQGSRTSLHGDASA